MKCESISDEGNEFMIHGEVMTYSKVFKYLGVEMGRYGIDYKKYLACRIEKSKRAADKLIGMGMNLGGLSLKAASIRPKLEARMCILPPLKKIADALEVSQCAILRRILRAGKTNSAINVNHHFFENKRINKCPIMFRLFLMD